VRITADLLRKMHACHTQVSLFIETFGDGAALTPGNVRKALAAGLDMEWFLIELGVSYDWKKMWPDTGPWDTTPERADPDYVIDRLFESKR